jgi:hypothetical protein
MSWSRMRTSFGTIEASLLSRRFMVGWLPRTSRPPCGWSLVLTCTRTRTERGRWPRSRQPIGPARDGMVETPNRLRHGCATPGRAVYVASSALDVPLQEPWFKGLGVPIGQPSILFRGCHACSRRMASSLRTT